MPTATTPPANGTQSTPAKPANGAPTQTQQPAPGVATNTDDVAKLRAELADAKSKLDAATRKSRVDNIEMMKFRDEKKGLGGKLSEHSRYERAFKAAGLAPEDLEAFRVNPERALKKALGDSYYDRIVESRLGGGQLSAEAIATEIAQGKQQAKDEAIAEWRREQEETAAKSKQEQEASEQRAREQLATEAGAFLEKSAADYPIFEGIPRAQVARAIAQYVEQEYHRTGKVLTSREAADAIEASEISRAERLAGFDKYRGKLTEKLKPATVPPVVGARIAGSTQSEQRRMQPNDPTQKRTFRTDDERRAAILAMKLPGES